MWILKLTNLFLFSLSGVFLVGWTYYEAAVNHFVDEQKPFYYFFLIWGGSLLLVLLRGIRLNRSISGSIEPAFRPVIKPYTLCLLAYCCGFTLHALAATTPEFDVAHLNMPCFLPALYLPFHFLTIGWILYTRGESEADRGLILIVLFHAMNGALFNTKFFLILGLAGITLIERLIENRGRLALPPPLIGVPFVILVLLVLLSTVEAINPVKATQALAHTGVCAAVLVLIVAKTNREKLCWQLVGAMLLASFLVVTAALMLLVATGRLLGPGPVLSTRLSIFYQHPNFLAPYFGMILVLGTVYGFRHRRRMKGWLVFLFMLPVAFLFWLTDSRAGFLGFAAGLVLFFLLASPLRLLLSKTWSRLRGRGRRILFAGVALVLVLAAVIAWAGSDRIKAAVQNSTRIRRALDYRLDAWANSVEVIKDHKLHGLGLDTFVSVKKYPPGSKFAHESTAPHPHNVFLYVAQSCGLPALAIFLILLGGCVYCSAAVIFRSDNPTARLLVLGCLCAGAVLLTCGFLDLGLSIVTLFPGPLWLFIGIVGALYRDRSNEKARHLPLDGLLAVLPAAAVIAAFFYGSLLPTMGRLLLKKAYLTEQFEGMEAGIRLAKWSLHTDPLLKQSREYLLSRTIQQKDYWEARDLIEEASRLEPENAELKLHQGTVHALMGEVEKAAEAYQEAVEIDHGSVNLPRYYAQLIMADAKSGWKENAVRHLKEAIRRDIAVINLISWEVNPHPAGRDDQVLKVGESAEIVRLEDVLDAIYRDRKAGRDAGGTQDRFDWFALFQAFNNALIFDKALAVLDDIDAIFGQREAATVQFHRASIERRMNRIDQSETHIDLAEQLGDPTNPGAVYYYQTRKSEALILQGKYGEAVPLLEEVIAKKKDYQNYQYSFVVALDNLLKALTATGAVQKKIHPLRQRLFFSGTKAERHPFLYDLAASYRSAGRTPEAERAVLDALDLMAGLYKRLYRFEYPTNMESVERAGFLLAEIYLDAGLGPEACLRRARYATDFYSSNPARLLFKCHFLIRLGMAKRARSAIALALMDDKENLVLLKLDIECCQMLDDRESLWNRNHDILRAYQAKGVDLEARAQSLFASLLEDQGDISLLLELLCALTCRFNFDHALNAVKIAVKIHPNESRIHWLAARIQRLDNQPEAARESLEEALRLNPADFKSARALENMRAHLDPGRSTPVKEKP